MRIVPPHDSLADVHGEARERFGHPGLRISDFGLATSFPKTVFRSSRCERTFLLKLGHDLCYIEIETALHGEAALNCPRTERPSVTETTEVSGRDQLRRRVRSVTALNPTTTIGRAVGSGTTLTLKTPRGRTAILVQ